MNFYNFYKQYSIYLMVLLCSVNGYLSGQPSIMKIPKAFFPPMDNVNLLDYNERTDNPWMVYSDRPGNITYTDKTGRTPFKKLDFLDPFYVVDDKDGWLQIYKADPDAPYTGTISRGDQNFGFIRIGFMLPWSDCMVNQFKIKKKAMIINKEQTELEKIRQGQGSFVKFYKDPELKVPTGKESKMLDILFIFKYYPDNTNPTSVLLGGIQRIKIDPEETNIYGWVDFKRVVEWDHRMAILPNTDLTAIAERKQKQVKSTFFLNRVTVRSFYKGDPVANDNIEMEPDKYLSSYPGAYLRYPVLTEPKIKSDSLMGIMRVGVAGNVHTLEGEQDLADFVVDGEVFRQLKKSSRNINIIFVIDGTSSMAKYFPKVAEGVTQVMNKLSKNSLNKFRFGAVIYRDKDEGPRLIDAPVQLTSNVGQISGLIAKVQAKDFHDKDTAEAVFFGLSAAMNAITVPADQSNYLILIGDAGNHHRSDKSQVPMETIIELMVKKGFNFFAIQVHNSGVDPSYNDFVNQSAEILKKVADKYYNISKIFYKKSNNLPDLPVPKVGDNPAIHKWVLTGGGISGTVRYAPVGKTGLSVEDIKSEIINSIDTINTTTNKFVVVLGNMVNGGSLQGTNKGAGVDKTMSDFMPEVVRRLMSANASADVFNEYNNLHWQVYKPSYTSLRKIGLTYDLWQYEVFYTQDEFFDVRKSFDKFVSSGTNAEKRKKFREAWILLLKSALGEISDQQADTLTIEQMERKIYGLPGKSKFLNLRLKDLIDPEKISDVQLINWQREIDHKGIKLEKISQASGPEADSYRNNDSNGKIYYWIPQSLLP